jgi:hypothetical protein
MASALLPRAAGTVLFMARRCARPACNAPATVTFTFDGLNRVMWINPLAEAAAYSAGDLCGRHAERLRPPLRWEVRDTRSTSRTEAHPTGEAAPSRYLAPATPPPEAEPRRPAAAAAARTDAKEPVPAIPRSDAAPRLVARTPLLERAFRAANVG